ncbi:MAG: hypothetical protein H6721_23940 [Sandaracinus sp.]|nr:hypothetical protein [Sandaracinus sp.]
MATKRPAAAAAAARAASAAPTPRPAARVLDPSRAAASRATCGGIHGGYRSASGNGDTSTDRVVYLGSGGSGGGAGAVQEAGGGGGGAGGGAIRLYAAIRLEIASTARLLANGAGAGGGGFDQGGSSSVGRVGGDGAGGGILLEAAELSIQATGTRW